jgi:regulator of RNase E activity RraA
MAARRYALDKEFTVTAQPAILAPDQLEALRRFDTPTVANALELLIGPERDRKAGIMASRIHPVFSLQSPLVGYAATFLFTTRHPPQGKLYADREAYWRYILTVPEPRVAIGQDMDPAPAAGAIWGEVQANIHLALGCNGVIVEGAIRDLDPLEVLNFPCFAREVVVGHAYAHLVDFGHPVEVGDVLVQPGDLIHADQHGVLVVPHHAAPELAATCRRIIEAERPLIALCKDRENFTLERLIEGYRKFSQEYPDIEPPAQV